MSYPGTGNIVMKEAEKLLDPSTATDRARQREGYKKEVSRVQ